MPSSNADEANDTDMNPSCKELRKELIDEVFDWIYGLSSVTEELSREIEKMTGLNRNQALTLKAISRSPSTRVSDLARSTFLNPATMVRVLDRLEEQDLITRTRSKKDRRVVEVALAGKAAAVRLDLYDVTHGNMMHCLGSTNERELKDLIKALRKLSSLVDTAYLHTSNNQSAKP